MLARPPRTVSDGPLTRSAGASRSRPSLYLITPGGQVAHLTGRRLGTGHPGAALVPFGPCPPPHHRCGPRWSTTTAAILVFAAIGAGCSSSTPIAATSTSTPAPPSEAGLPPVAPPPPITWATCPTPCDPAVRDRPRARSTTATRRPAPSRSPWPGRRPPVGRTSGGDLVVNPGGPGESGLQILPVLLPLLPPAVRAASDVVSFDPRGTGASAPLQCGTVPATVTAVGPVPARAGLPLPGTPVFAGLGPGVRHHPSGTDRGGRHGGHGPRHGPHPPGPRRRPPISFYGLSYGTVLGTVYAELFPQPGRAMVLDGAVDMDAPLATQAAEQAPAAERSLAHLLRHLRRDRRPARWAPTPPGSSPGCPPR